MRCCLRFTVLTVQLFRVCFIFLYSAINRVSGWVGSWVIDYTDNRCKEGLYIEFLSCSHFIQEDNTE